MRLTLVTLGSFKSLVIQVYELQTFFLFIELLPSTKHESVADIIETNGHVYCTSFLLSNFNQVKENSKLVFVDFVFYGS